MSHACRICDVWELQAILISALDRFLRSISLPTDCDPQPTLDYALLRLTCQEFRSPNYATPITLGTAAGIDGACIHEVGMPLFGARRRVVLTIFDGA